MSSRRNLVVGLGLASASVLFLLLALALPTPASGPRDDGLPASDRYLGRGRKPVASPPGL